MGIVSRLFVCSTYVGEVPRYVGEDPALYLCGVRERADEMFASKPTYPLVSSQYSSPLWHNTICRSPVTYQVGCSFHRPWTLEPETNAKKARECAIQRPPWPRWL